MYIVTVSEIYTKSAIENVIQIISTSAAAYFEVELIEVQCLS